MELGAFLRSSCIAREMAAVNKCGQVDGNIGGQNCNSLVSEVEIIMFVKIRNLPGVYILIIIGCRKLAYPLINTIEPAKHLQLPSKRGDKKAFICQDLLIRPKL